MYHKKHFRFLSLIKLLSAFCTVCYLTGEWLRSVCDAFVQLAEKTQFTIICTIHLTIRREKVVAYAMKRVAAGAHLPTPWLFEPAKRPDDRADYCRRSCKESRNAAAIFQLFCLKVIFPSGYCSIIVEKSKQFQEK